MYMKAGRQVLAQRSDRLIVDAGLFLICAMLAGIGVGATALWCFLPAAALVELLSLVSPALLSRGH